ncbi:MAG: DUF4367 domain-containing protein [Clostridia bacterium]|nr:DUF4367 domain-containing protein [Clostridia bacterium]
MNETEKYLLDAAIDLAVTKEFDEFTKLDAGDTELPAALDKRVRGILRRKKFTQFCMDNIRVVAAACLCILVAGIGIGVPLYVEATENDYYMQTEQDMYRNSISVQFLCKEEEAPAEKTLKPNSAAEVLENFNLVRTYSTDSVYIEEYDGVRYEQTALHAEGQYILPTRDKSIRNIVINDYMAVLVFDAGEAAIVWRDDAYSYLLEGRISSDDAMRFARLICE